MVNAHMHVPPLPDNVGQIGGPGRASLAYLGQGRWVDPTDIWKFQNSGVFGALTLLA